MLVGRQAQVALVLTGPSMSSVQICHTPLGGLSPRSGASQSVWPTVSLTSFSSRASCLYHQVINSERQGDDREPPNSLVARVAT